MTRPRTTLLNGWRIFLMHIGANLGPTHDQRRIYIKTHFMMGACLPAPLGASGNILNTITAYYILEGGPARPSRMLEVFSSCILVLSWRSAHDQKRTNIKTHFMMGACLTAPLGASRNILSTILACYFHGEGPARSSRVAEVFFSCILVLSWGLRMTKSALILKRTS